MGSDYLISSNVELEEKRNQNICVSESDSFVVDVERFSHLVHNKDTNGNSTITLQRNVSRKGYSKGGYTNKNIKPTTSNQSNDNALPGSTPEKPTSPLLHHHHQIVVKNASENKQFGGRLHSPSIWSWSVDPRRILIFFATLSSLGTILLIYFTLSIRKQ